MVGKKTPSIQDLLISALAAVNDDGQLSHLIKELIEIESIIYAAEAFTLLTSGLEDYPHLINHPNRHSLDKLLTDSFVNASAEDLFAVLERSGNQALKNRIHAYVKQLVSQYKTQGSKKITAPAKSLIDAYAQYAMETFNPQTPSKLGIFLLQDFAAFVSRLQKPGKTAAPKPRAGG